ncbi:unnamed protein product [Prorocentrum cordatum]|uniref:Uncharacterized protein n=1 Tax=Prorocentrum cordatum TaxID=2364126 RepID=A0ABN9Y8L5_9DINO|nr:unnamed protein product [Polarella glacialis]
MKAAGSADPIPPMCRPHGQAKCNLGKAASTAASSSEAAEVGSAGHRHVESSVLQGHPDRAGCGATAAPPTRLPLRRERRRLRPRGRERVRRGALLELPGSCVGAGPLAHRALVRAGPEGSAFVLSPS